MNIVPRSFYDRDTKIVARELLGKPFISTLSGKPLYGRIIEVEAYQSDDEACHAYNGKSKRNAALFGPVGHTYVYLCYGIHYCLNIVARNTTELPAGGVLIRGISVSPHRDLSKALRIDGPGRATKALSITTDHIGIDVSNPASPFIVLDDKPLSGERVVITPRIGISKGTDKLWRFVCID